MNITSLLTGGFIGEVMEGIDNLFTSDDERLERENELEQTKLYYALHNKQIDASLVLGQQQINKEEAKHSSVFVAGWRPFIGWVGGIALAYQFILYAMLIWIWTLLQAKNIVPMELSPPPILDSEALYALVLGMLGIGVQRSYDKTKGVDTKNL